MPELRHDLGSLCSSHRHMARQGMAQTIKTKIVGKLGLGSYLFPGVG